MSEPLISIIIPFYNQASPLKLALDSIKNQTYKNIEVIIVDDGSDFRLQTPDFNYNLPMQLINQENRGAPSARNRGLERALGEYIIFWDADVVGVSRMLENMKECLDENLQTSFAYSDFNIQYSIFNIPKLIKAQNFDFNKLKQRNYIHSTSLIRRSGVIKWDESLKRFQDWDLWLTMAEQGKTGIYIPETLFTIIAKGTMSAWLPKFVYHKPWKFLPFIHKKIIAYEKAKMIVQKKHKLL